MEWFGGLKKTAAKTIGLRLNGPDAGRLQALQERDGWSNTLRMIMDLVNDRWNHGDVYCTAEHGPEQAGRASCAASVSMHDSSHVAIGFWRLALWQEGSMGDCLAVLALIAACDPKATARAWQRIRAYCEAEDLHPLEWLHSTASSRAECPDPESFLALFAEPEEDKALDE